MVSLLWAAHWLVLAVFTAIYFYIIFRLRNKHRQTWEALGRPSIVYNSRETSRKWLKWARAGEYKTLGDNLLTRSLSIEKWLFKIYLLILLLIILFTIVLPRLRF